jgi:hypothetical protein
MPERDRRGAVQSGLDDAQPPTLLERGDQYCPGRAQQFVFALLGDESGELHPIGDAKGGHEVAQARLPPTVAGHNQP